MRCFVPENRKRLFQLNLQMFKRSTYALTLWFLLVLESSAREPHKQLPASPFVENKIVRARDLGIPFEGKPRKFNAITDVAGVEVGYTTLISGEGKLEVGKGPVRTGPLPTSSLPSPLISVVYPTSTPATSVIALNFLGLPSNGIPRSRARTILFSTKGVAGRCF